MFTSVFDDMPEDGALVIHHYIEEKNWTKALELAKKMTIEEYIVRLRDIDATREKLKSAFVNCEKPTTDQLSAHLTFVDDDLDLVKDDPSVELNVSNNTTTNTITASNGSSSLFENNRKFHATHKLDETKEWVAVVDDADYDALREQFLKAVLLPTTATLFCRGGQRCATCGKMVNMDIHGLIGARFYFSALYVHEVEKHNRPILPEIADYLRSDLPEEATPEDVLSGMTVVLPPAVEASA